MIDLEEYIINLADKKRRRIIKHDMLLMCILAFAIIGFTVFNILIAKDDKVALSLLITFSILYLGSLTLDFIRDLATLDREYFLKKTHYILKCNIVSFDDYEPHTVHFKCRDTLLKCKYKKSQLYNKKKCVKVCFDITDGRINDYYLV